MCVQEAHRPNCAEQVGNEECLTKRIVFGQPSHSSFQNHVDCFDALQRAPRNRKRAIAFGEPNPFLHDPMILLDHIVQVLALIDASRNVN